MSFVISEAWDLNTTHLNITIQHHCIFFVICWTLNPVWNVCFRDSGTFIDWGNDKPFLFVIDPDLDGPIHPFLVHCDFENRVSRIFHDKMFKQFINHCPTKDCYNLDITYVNSIKQIEAIISVSKSCQQLIQVSRHSVEKQKNTLT